MIKERKKLSVILFAFLLVFSNSLGYNDNSINSNNLIEKKTRSNFSVEIKKSSINAPIIIQNDDDIKKYNLLGEGTENKPFRIENLTIITEEDYGILIENSQKYFIIKNNIVNAKNYGIYINNITKAKIIIEGNNCSFNNIAGIFIRLSDETTIENNICSSNGELGIGVSISREVEILTNNCSYNLIGIKIVSSPITKIFDNKILFNKKTGLYIYQSDYNELLYNSCNDTDGYGFYIYNCKYLKIKYNILANSSNKGIVINSTSYSQITTNKFYYNKDTSVELLNGYSIDIKYNQLVSNKRGFYIKNSRNTTFEDNLIFGSINGQGLEIEYSNYSIIQYNRFYNNSLFAIFSNQSNFLRIHFNDFVNNSVFNLSQCFDNGLNNSWYNSSVNLGNYWNDWNGSGIYNISGNKGYYDLYPLNTSVVTYQKGIVINKDVNVPLTYSFKGNGSIQNPFVIENYMISSYAEIGITIRDVNYYFIIKNNIITSFNTGILCEKLNEGSIQILNNKIKNQYNKGIYINEANGTKVVNNSIKNQFYTGIYVERSHRSEINGNSLVGQTYFAIQIYKSHTSKVKNNYINNKKKGISVSISHYAVIENNTCYNQFLYGILLDNAYGSTVNKNIFGGQFFSSIKAIQTNNSTISNNIIFDSKNGIFFHNSKNNIVVSNEIYNCDSGIFIIYNSENTIIESNLIYNNNFYGLYSTVNNLTVKNNFFENNSYFGIFLWNCDYSVIFNNTLKSNHRYGIKISSSSNIFIIYNSLLMNHEYGVFIQKSEYCLIVYNSFVENGNMTSQAYDDSRKNLWFSKKAKEGNYWSDWETKKSKYIIDGKGKQKDKFPLLEVPETFTYSLLELITERAEAELLLPLAFGFLFFYMFKKKFMKRKKDTKKMFNYSNESLFS